jgi:hypothetical protein
VFSTNNIIRRYTPPTCTLEIQGKRSPLARWKGDNLIRSLWFQLSFSNSHGAMEESIEIYGDRFQLEELCEAVSEYIQRFLTHNILESEIVTKTTPPEKGNKPYLQGKGLLHHELFFSSSIGKSSHRTIPLTATQLFDLASALDDFTKEIVLVPAEKDERPPQIQRTIVKSRQKKIDRPKSPKQLPAWTSMAASFLIAAGATGTAMHFYYVSRSSDNSQIALDSNPTNSLAQTTPTPNSNRIVPPPPNTATIPIPTASIPPSLTNRDRLSPPTPIPTPSNSPNQIAVNLDRNSNLPSTPKTTPQPTTKIETNTNLTRSQNPQKKQPNTNTTARKNEKELVAIVPNNPPDLQTSEESIKTTTTEDRVYPDYTPNPMERRTTADNPSTLESVPNSAVTTPTENTTTGTATATAIDRVSQIQQYFQSRWQPPTELNEVLEYRLLVGSNGVLQNITPVGKAAATYLDRTNMPLLNESFVPPANESGSTKVRLVLNPDGTVKVFQE